VGSDGIDFVLLTDVSARSWGGRPSIGGLVAAGLRTLAARLNSGRWSTVTLNASPSRPVRGAVVLSGTAPGAANDRLLARCLARTVLARRSGARVICLGGQLAGRSWLARQLARETGLPCASGEALERATLLDAALVFLRWRGVDPARAQAVVLAGPDESRAAEAAVEYLADRTGRIGVWGLDGLKGKVLAERLRAGSGAVLETYRSLERCLTSAQLVIVAWPGPAVAPEPIPCDAGRAPPAVLVDLRPGRRAAGERPDRLVVLSGREDPLPKDSVRNPPAPGRVPGGGPPCLSRVLYGRPPNLAGLSEPGLPPGLVSASLAEAFCSAWPTVSRPERRSPRWTAWTAGMAGRMGFFPSALTLLAPGSAPVRFLTGQGSGPYNRLDLPGPWSVTE
jgi:hypothetical protein